MKISKDIIQKFIESEEVELLFNIEEDESVDFKSQFYLDNEEGRYEFAKDVTSFVNSTGGGWLIFGVTTVDSESKDTEVSDSATPVKDYSSETKGYAKQYIYPEMKDGKDYEVTFIETDAASKKGILILRINPSRDGPRLISKIVEDGSRMREIVFGYAQRKGMSSRPDTLVELYKKMKVGFSNQSQMIEQIAEDVALTREILSVPNQNRPTNESVIKVRMEE